MGLFSTLGKIAGGIFGGPVGGAIGGAIGGYADGKSEQRHAKRVRDNYYVDMRAAAEKGQFNPLEVLRNGGGGGYATAAQIPSIASSTALQGSFDHLEQVLSGDYAREQERKKVEHDIFMRRAEIELAGGAGDVVARTEQYGGGVFRMPKVSQNSGREVMTTQGPKDISEIADPTPIDESGRITDHDDGGTGTVLKPRERIVLSNGRTTTVTVGPDLDELVTGTAAEVGGWIGEKIGVPVTKEDVQNRQYDEMINQEPPIQWQSQWGKRPRSWVRWSNARKMDYIRSH